jgi:hypothetical protein
MVITIISTESATFRSVLAITKAVGQQGMQMGVSKRRPARATYETAINDVIAACHGDLRGAVQALLMANEYLEMALVEAQSALHLAPSGELALTAFRTKRPRSR